MTALVPPIATAGLALSLGRVSIAAGAALLFGTNMVAIVLGSAVCLWAVGFRATHQHGRLQRWVPIGLVISTVLFGLTVWALEIGEEIPDDLSDRLRETAEHAGANVVGMDLTGAAATPVLRMVIEARTGVDPGLAERLRELAAGSLGQSVRVRLETRLVTETAR